MKEYRRADGVEMAPLEGETVLYHPATRQFCVLNETAAFLWTLLEQPKTESQLADAVSDEFEEAAGDDVARDVRGALERLTELDLAIEA